jgi:hypothetical protein
MGFVFITFLLKNINNKNMKCKNCKKDINDGAKKCPECQSDLRNWFIRHKILSVILILFILGSILSGIGESKKTNLTPTVNSDTNTENKVSENTKKEYVSVMNMKTSSNKNSDTFNLSGGKQKLTYKSTGQYVVCSIYVLDEGSDLQAEGGFPIVMVAKAESGETILRKKAGQYYIAVNASNNCEIELLEER